MVKTGSYVAGLRLRIRSDPDLFGWIRILKFFTGSYSGYVKLYKKLSFYTFSGEFFNFSGKKINIKISQEI